MESYAYTWNADAYPDDFFSESHRRLRYSVDAKVVPQHKPMAIPYENQRSNNFSKHENFGRLFQCIKRRGFIIIHGATQLGKLAKDWARNIYNNVISCPSWSIDKDTTIRLYWKYVLEARGLQAVDTLPDTPVGYICGDGVEMPLDFAIFSRSFGYCFSLPSDLLRPDIRADLLAGPRIDRGIIMLHETREQPGRDVPKAIATS